MAAGAVYAVGDTGQDLQQIRLKIDNIRDNISDNQQKESKLEKELGQVSKRLTGLVQGLRSLDKKVVSQKKRLDKLQTIKVKQQQKMDVLNADLAKVIRASYALGQQGRLRVLLSTEDASSVARNQVYFNYVADSQHVLIKEIEQGMEALYSTEKGIVASHEVLKDLKRNKLQKKTDLQQQQGRRQRVLHRLKKQLGEQTKTLAQLLADKVRLQDLVDELQILQLQDMTLQGQEAFSRLKGKLAWPIKGPLIQRFGQRRKGSDHAAQGVMIRAKVGKTVQAIAHGRVVFSDWLRGFGMLVIIDHGEEFMSLYGQNQSLYKEVGEWVVSGEEIATVGDGGVSSQTGLYFELRKKGKPINPQHWCVKR